jgi:hypothetical protein
VLSAFVLFSDPEGRGGLGEARGTVEAVVIGDREGREAEPLSLGDEVLGGGGAVEEGVRGVRVQLGIGDGVLRTLDPSSRMGGRLCMREGASIAIC